MELDVSTDDVSDGIPNPGLAASDISDEDLKQLLSLLRSFKKVDKQIQHAKAMQTAAGKGRSTTKSRRMIALLDDKQKSISDEISVLKGNAPREPLAPAPTKPLPLPTGMYPHTSVLWLKLGRNHPRWMLQVPRNLRPGLLRKM